MSQNLHKPVTKTTASAWYVNPMALTVTISKDDASKLLAQRIATALLNHPDIKRGSGKFNALPETVEARATPLAQLAYEHFAAHIEKGSQPLLDTIREASVDDSPLVKAFEAHLLSHPHKYPGTFYQNLPDETNPHGLRRTALPMANKLVKALCTQLENTMFLNGIEAAAVTELTPQARDLATKLDALYAAKQGPSAA